MTASITLIGNPNCGKTTVFNALTGAHQQVGNWPGVTVEKRSGFTTHGHNRLEVVDLPGIYSLLSSDTQGAMDEQIAREYLHQNPNQIIVNVIDASSLERGLFLTTQLLDLDAQVIVALNMMDIADKHGLHIDSYRLSQALGCPVIPLIANRKDGIGALMDVIESMLDKPEPRLPILLDAQTETDIAELSQSLKSTGLNSNIRMVATALLSGNPATEYLGETTFNYTPHTHPANISIQRYKAVDALLKPIVSVTPVRSTLTDIVDSVVLHPILAFPIFLFVIYLMFMFTINVGSAFIDLFDITAMALFVEGPRQLYAYLGFPDWISTFLADGVGGGAQLVASFIPVIGCMFLFLSFLEDSGYLGRAAFIIDRLMRRIGLPGKSFVPLIVGFGCNVPAVMATRGLDNEQDRILTTVMAPYMSCGARLTVYALFAAAFFQENGQNIVFALYLVGIGVAVISALIVRKHLLGRTVSTFVMELPVYHMPTLSGLALHTWHKLRGFILRAGKAIIAVVIVLNVVSSIGTDGSVGNQNTEKSVLAVIGKTATPLLQPMGINEENWPATVGILTGVFAKEVVVGTLDALYSQMNRANSDIVVKADFDFLITLKQALQTVPDNLAQLTSLASDPLGLNLGDLHDSSVVAEEQDVRLGTLALLQTLFVDKLAAFSYLLFILLYIPCVATVAAIYKELGKFWAVFTTAWSIAMAYVVAVLTYQIGSLFVPSIQLSAQSVTLHVAGTLLLGFLCFFSLIHWGKRKMKMELIPVTNL